MHTIERTQKKGEILHSIVFLTTNKDMNLFLLGFKIVYLSNPFFYIGVTMLLFCYSGYSLTSLITLVFHSDSCIFIYRLMQKLDLSLTIIISIMLGIVVAINID